MAERTVGTAIDEYISAGFSPDEVVAEFKKSHGIDPSKMDPKTPMRALDQAKEAVDKMLPFGLGKSATTTAEPEPETHTPTIEEDAENSGSTERQDLARAKLPKQTQELAYHPFEKLIGYVKGAYRAVNPTPEEAKRAAQEEEARNASMMPGETDAEGNLLREPVEIDKKTGLPKQDHPVWAGVKGAVKGLTVIPALVNPPEGSPVTEEARRAAKADLHERADKTHPIINAITDTGDVVMALPKLVGDVLLPDWVPKGSTDEQAQALAQRHGKEQGKAFVGGVVGGTSAITEGMAHEPLKTLEARPATVAATFIPLARGLGKLGKAALATEPGIAAVEAAGRAEQALGGAVERATPEVVKRAGNVVQDFVERADAYMVKKGVPPDIIGSFKRWAAEGFNVGDERASAMVEKIATDPDHAAAEVASIVKRAANKARRGQLGEVKQGEMPPVEERPAGPIEPPRELVKPLDGNEHPPANVTAPSEGALRRQGAVEDLMQRHPDIASTVKRITQHLADGETDASALETLRKKVADQLLSALDDASAVALKDPVFRKRVQDNLIKAIERSNTEAIQNNVQQLKTTGRAEILPRIKAQVEDILNRAAEEGIETDVGTLSKSIPVAQIIRETFAQVATKEARNQITANAMEVVGGELSEQASKKMLKSGIAAEQGRIKGEVTPEYEAQHNATMDTLDQAAKEAFGPDAQYRRPTVEAAAYADAVADAVAKGDLHPQIMPKGIEPADVAAALRWRAHMEPVGGAKVPPKVLLRIAKQIEAYVPLDKILEVEGHADPLVNQALKWHEQAKQGLNDPAISGLSRTYKGNLTARNPVAGINNAGSNVGLQTVARGVNPVELVGNAMVHALRWMRYQAGVANKNPEVNMFHKALEQTNLLSTDLVAADFGHVGSKIDITNLPWIGKGFKALYEGIAPKDIPKVGAWLDKMAPALAKAKIGLEPAYRVGDNLFKLEETAHNYFDRARPYLKMLMPNKEMTVKLSNHRQATIQRVGDSNTFRVSSPQNPSAGASLMSIDNPKLIRILVEAAGEPAQAKFFNYSDTGLFAKWLKASPMVGAKSGFYTYLSKAIDIPFIKKGQIYRSLVDSGFNVETNSPNILVHQAGENFALGARKAILINGLTQDLKNKSQQELGKVFKFMPDEDKAQLVTALTNPGYIASANFGSWNFASPSLKLFRFLADQYAAATRPERSEVYPTKPGTKGTPDIKLDSLPEAQRNKIMRARSLLSAHDNGELWAASDALDIIGFAGDPIADTLRWISDTEESGKVLHLDDVMQRFGAAFVGAVPTIITDLAVGKATEGTSLGAAKYFTTRNKTVSADEQLTIPFKAWVVRKLTGMGWSVKNLKDSTNPGKPGSYFNKMQKEWNASLNVQKNIATGIKAYALAKQAGDKAKMDEAKEFVRSAKIDKAIIKAEVKRAYANYVGLARKTMNIQLGPFPEDIDEADRAAAKILEKTPEQLNREMDGLVKDALGPSDVETPTNDED